MAMMNLPRVYSFLLVQPIKQGKPGTFVFLQLLDESDT